jgi:Domain of unknown function DUF29
MPDEQRDQAVTTSPHYDEDFYAWTQHQATILRGVLCPRELDALNLAEEIEDLGKSHRRELRSRLRVLVMHLLKWRYQPEGRMDSHSWEDTIREQRKEIEDALEDSPSLRQAVGPYLLKDYGYAKDRTARQTGLRLETFPEACPWTAEQVLDMDFWPEVKVQG